MSGNKQSSVETIAAEYVETFLATGMAYEFTAESIAHRSFIDGYTAGSREVGQLKAALALGQENCDAEYDTLREERDEARAQLAVALTAANAEELRNTQAELARVKAEKFNYSKELRGVKCANDILNERHQTDIEELAALRRDKDRLDWMDAMSSASHMHFDRAAIDAAMNGGANG